MEITVFSCLRFCLMLAAVIGSVSCRGSQVTVNQRTFGTFTNVALSLDMVRNSPDYRLEIFNSTIARELKQWLNLSELRPISEKYTKDDLYIIKSARIVFDFNEPYYGHKTFWGNSWALYDEGFSVTKGISDEFRSPFEFYSDEVDVSEIGHRENKYDKMLICFREQGDIWAKDQPLVFNTHICDLQIRIFNHFHVTYILEKLKSSASQPPKSEDTFSYDIVIEAQSSEVKATHFILGKDHLFNPEWNLAFHDRKLVNFLRRKILFFRSYR